MKRTAKHELSLGSNQDVPVLRTVLINISRLWPVYSGKLWFHSSA